MTTHLTPTQIDIQRMHPNAYNTKRTFGGKTTGIEHQGDRNFYKAMLKAYLKGKSTFEFGFISKPNGMRERAVYRVQYDQLESNQLK